MAKIVYVTREYTNDDWYTISGHKPITHPIMGTDRKGLYPKLGDSPFEKHWCKEYLTYLFGEFELQPGESIRLEVGGRWIK